MKNNQAEKSKNGDRKLNNNSSRNQVQNSQATNAQLKVILKIKQAKPNELQIKTSFTDSKGREVKEMISTFQDRDTKELLVEMEKELFGLRL